MAITTMLIMVLIVPFIAENLVFTKYRTAAKKQSRMTNAKTLMVTSYSLLLMLDRWVLPTPTI